MEALRLATNKGKPTPTQESIKLFHDLFIRSVKYWGRVYELGLGLAYNLLGKHPLARIEIVPGMLSRGKLVFLPHRAKAANEIKRVFARVELLRKETTEPRGEKS